MPLISCILPVYNGEKYLKAAILSVLSQTLREFELIVVDDGSTDETPALLAEMVATDSRIVVVRQANAGIVGALNAGLRIAQGRYVARMDADDICLPDRFEYQASHLDRHPECVLVGGYAETFSNERSPLGLSTCGWRGRTDLTCFPPKIAVSVHPLIMMRAKTLRTMGGYREGYPFAEDYDLFIRASRFGEIQNPPKIVLRYRVHAGSISVQRTETQEWAALAAEFDAMRLRLPAPPQSATITHSARSNPDCSQEISDTIALAYFWFRVWRRRRNDDLEHEALLKMLPFLLGLTPAAWTLRYGIPLRVRMLGSLLLHLRVVDAVRNRLRRAKASRSPAIADGARREA